MKERRSSKRRAWMWAAGIIILCLLAGGLSYYEWLRPKLPSVHVQNVHRQNLKNIIFSSGTVKPDARQVITTAELPSPVAKLDVHVGEHVQSGQVLLECQGQEQMSKLKAAQQQEKAAEQAYAALRARISANNHSLAGLNNISNSVANQISSVIQTQLNASLQTQLQAAQTAITEAQSAVSQAQLAYDATTVKASLSGSVVIASADGIQPDGTTGPVIEVVGTGKQIVANLSEVDAVNVKQGMAVTVSSQAFPNKQWNGKVTQVSAYASTTNSGTGQVQILIGQLPDNWIVPLGYQVDLHIVSEIHHHVPVVPYSSLVQHGTNYAVFLFKAGTAKEVDVTLGITANSVVEVDKGVNPGDKVIVNPPAGLKNGERVREKG